MCLKMVDYPKSIVYCIANIKKTIVTALCSLLWEMNFERQIENKFKQCSGCIYDLQI